jgi:hypothetical protein
MPWLHEYSDPGIIKFVFATIILVGMICLLFVSVRAWVK